LKTQISKPVFHFTGSRVETGRRFRALWVSWIRELVQPHQVLAVVCEGQLLPRRVLEGNFVGGESLGVALQVAFERQNFETGFFI
jgi:hypothetical protein